MFSWEAGTAPYCPVRTEPPTLRRPFPPNQPAGDTYPALRRHLPPQLLRRHSHHVERRLRELRRVLRLDARLRNRSTRQYGNAAAAAGRRSCAVAPLLRQRHRRHGRRRRQPRRRRRLLLPYGRPRGRHLVQHVRQPALQQDHILPPAGPQSGQRAAPVQGTAQHSTARHGTAQRRMVVVVVVVVGEGKTDAQTIQWGRKRNTPQLHYLQSARLWWG
jgi:hypothetical protein